MEPHLLHDMLTRTTGQSMADLTYNERMPAARPRRPSPVFWRRKSRELGR